MTGTSDAHTRGRHDAPLHIGYLVQQFPPEVGAGPARVVETARHWLAAGARVTVLTGMPNRPEGRIHPAYRGRLFCEETLEGMRVLRSWLYASPEHGFARTLLNNTTFMLTSAVQGIARARGLDVLIASSPPFFPHLSGEAVRRARRLPIVLEVRDLWPDYVVEMGILGADSLAARALFRVERALLRRADAVTVVTESFRRRIEEKGVPRERIHVMPAGVDGDQYFPSDEPPPLPALAHGPGEFIVGYLGNFGAGQALGSVLEAAARLREVEPRIRFVLVGDGPQGRQLRETVDTLRLSNVSIHPPIPKSDTRAFYAHCDVCLVPLAALRVFQETIPSKLFEILACERPIIASVEGEARTVAESSGAAWITPPEDAAALVEAVLRAAGTPRPERARMGASGRRFALAHFSRAAIAARYLELLRAVAAGVQGPNGV